MIVSRPRRGRETIRVLPRRRGPGTFPGERPVDIWQTFGRAAGPESSVLQEKCASWQKAIDKFGAVR